MGVKREGERERGIGAGMWMGWVCGMEAEDEDWEGSNWWVVGRGLTVPYFDPSTLLSAIATIIFMSSFFTRYSGSQPH